MARAAPRPVKTTRPWGDEEPTCGAAVFGRDVPANGGDTTCTGPGKPVGPAAVTAGTLDATVGIGIQGMGANAGEWMRDSMDDYQSVCWLSQPLSDPSCTDPGTDLHVVRGSSWESSASEMLCATRGSIADPAASIGVGFRCKRNGTGP